MSGLVKLWLTIFFYSVLFLVVFSCFLFFVPDRVTWKGVVTSLFPVVRSHYWFLTCYVLLYVVSPFLGAGVRALNQRQHEYLMGLVLVLWSIIPTTNLGSMYYNEFLLYVMLFIVAAYIRLHEIRRVLQVRWLVMALIGSSVLSFTSVFITDLMQGMPVFSAISDKISWRMWIGRNSPLTILMALSIFLMLLKVNLGQIKWINTISGCMLGVYLIHENSFVRPYLWQTLLQVKEHFEVELNFISWSFSMIVAVFLCVLVLSMCGKR